MKTPAVCPESKEGKPHSYSRKKGFGNFWTCDECGDVDLQSEIEEQDHEMSTREKRARAYVTQELCMLAEGVNDRAKDFVAFATTEVAEVTKEALTCDECKRIRGFCSKHSPQMVVDEGVLVPRKLLEKVLQDYQQALYAAHERWGATSYAQQARLDELSTIVESDPS